MFTGLPIVQASGDEVQTTLVGHTLTERSPGGGARTVEVAPGEYGPLLRERFGLDVDGDVVSPLLAVAPPP